MNLVAGVILGFIIGYLWRSKFKIKMDRCKECRETKKIRLVKS